MKLTKTQRNVIIDALNHYKDYLEQCYDDLNSNGKETLSVCKDTLKAIEIKLIL